METSLEIAKKTIIEQDKVLKALTAKPHSLAVVLAVNDEGVLVSSGATATILEAPPKVKLRPGDVVTLSPLTGNIIGVTSHTLAMGNLHSVTGFKGNMVEIDGGGDTKLLVLSDKKPAIGDQVLLDPNRLVIVGNIGQPPAPPRPPIAHITWDDIGGQESAKAALREVIELPFSNPKLYALYGKTPPKGVLLSGPPGCGKTMLGKATASALSGLDGGFIHMKGPEVLDPYVGVAEAKIRAAFALARRFKQEHGRPAILFVDEAEAVLSRRGSSRSSDVDKTIVPQFLAEMDGLEESAAVVVLATNRPDMLDPAVVRDGRVDRRVAVTRPCQQDANDILRINLRPRPTMDSVDSLANHTASLLYGDATVIQGKPARESLNGAMIAGLVARASTGAMMRDIKRGVTKPSGISHGDMEEAVRGMIADSGAIALE